MKLKNYFFGACEEMAYLVGDIEQTYYAMVNQPNYSPEAFLDAVRDPLCEIAEIYQELLSFGGKQILGDDILCTLFDEEIADVIAQAEA